MKTISYRFQKVYENKCGHKIEEKVFESDGVTIKIIKEFTMFGFEMSQKIWMSNLGYVDLQTCKSWLREKSFA